MAWAGTTISVADGVKLPLWPLLRETGTRQQMKRRALCMRHEAKTRAKAKAAKPASAFKRRQTSRPDASNQRRAIRADAL
jgi:hypothetical protein